MSSSPSPKWYHYAAIREDVPSGVQLAQLGHATGESAGNLPEEGASIVVLGLPSEGAIRHLSKKLTDAGIEHKLIIEPDAPYSGQAMAIGFAPTTNRKPIQKLTSGIPLAGSKGCRCCRGRGKGW